MHIYRRKEKQMTITFKKYYFILKGMELEGDMFRE